MQNTFSNLKIDHTYITANGDDRQETVATTCRKERKKKQIKHTVNYRPLEELQNILLEKSARLNVPGMYHISYSTATVYCADYPSASHIECRNN